MTTTLRNNRLHSGRRCWPGLRFLKAEENDVERRQDDQGQERRHEQTPMIAKAIGPQNTVGAIGMKPRTVEMAVSMMGRNRETAPSTTASHGSRPCERSASICSMRMTALRAIMPIKRQNPEDRNEAERPT